MEPQRLTAREIEIINMVANGLSSKEIGMALRISSFTVHTHRRNIMAKLSVKNSISMVNESIKRGLIEK